MKTIRNTAGYLLAAMMLFLLTGCAVVDMEVGDSATKVKNDAAANYTGTNQFTNPEYKVTFDANGGTGTMSSLTVMADQSTTLSANAFTRSGYAFLGWATSSDATIDEYADTSNYTMANSNVTLYAVWAALYTITFDANSGTGTMNNLSVAEGASITLTKNTYTKSGHAFLGWATSSGAGSYAHADNANYTMGNSNVTLYAVWTAADQKITFDASGGSGSMSQLETKSGETVSLTTNTFTKDGYIFLGWATSSGASSADFTDGANYTMGNSDVTLYAVWKSTSWSHQAYLKAPNAQAGDVFGYSVAISGDTIVVGAYFEDSNQTTITNGTTASSNNSATWAGAAYVFVRNTSNQWSQQAYLKAPNTIGVACDQPQLYCHYVFGNSVSVSGDTIVVGAWGEDSSQTGVTNEATVSYNNSANNAGAAYVFVRDTSTNQWSHQAYLKAPLAGSGDLFGYSVSSSGDTIVVGAHYEDSGEITIINGTTAGTDNAAKDSGAAYVFVRNTSNQWSQQAYLKAPNGVTSWPYCADTNYPPYCTYLFGHSVSVSGDTIVVGAPGEDSSMTSVTNGASTARNHSATDAGAAYVFVRNTSNQWSQQAYLKASNAGANDLFGDFVSISGDTVVVGAKQEDSSSGAAYVFTRDGTIWSQRALLKAENVGSSADEFGYSVSISGDTIIVGAKHEDSNQNTITNNITSSSSYGADDGSADNSGAAYVFVRSDVNWTPQSYLKAPNAGTSDAFGHSLAISGDTVVVGAPNEDSNATSISNGTTASSNNSASEAGAAYVFVR